VSQRPKIACNSLIDMAISIPREGDGA
jgi:hypothetical protein